ncbi:MAG: TetR/AcrR family transcriptional regulator [Miltoncostaeaceae bacterium]
MPPDGTKTRERLLDAAEKLTLGRGFSATTVDQVIAEAESSKGAFFHHFASKSDLGRALVARYAAADIASLEHFMGLAEAKSDDPAVQLVEFVRSFEEIGDEIAEDHQSSCLYASFVQHHELVTDGGAELIVDAIVAWRVALAEKIAAAAELRPLSVDVDPDDLADHVFVTFEGAFILARATSDTSHMRTQLRVLRQSLESLLGVASEVPSGAR